MSTPFCRIVTLAVAAVFVVATATTASARPKKRGVERHNVEQQATSTTNCYGTPIIMQGMGCPKHVARGEEQEPTQREIEVLQLISEGLVNREIGQRLFLSEETVKSHVRHLLAKLQARSRAHAVAVGFRRGIIG